MTDIVKYLALFFVPMAAFAVAMAFATRKKRHHDDH